MRSILVFDIELFGRKKALIENFFEYFLFIHFPFYNFSIENLPERKLFLKTGSATK